MNNMSYDDARGIIALIMDAIAQSNASGGFLHNALSSLRTEDQDIFKTQTAENNRLYFQIASTQSNSATSSAVNALGSLISGAYVQNTYDMAKNSVNGTAAYLASKKGSQDRIDAVSIFNTVMNNPALAQLKYKLVGLEGTPEFFVSSGEAANAIAEASGSGLTADLFSTGRRSANIRNAANLQKIIYDMAVDPETGKKNLGFTKGLSLEEIGMLSSRILSREATYRYTGKDGVSRPYASTGENIISDKFKESLKDMTSRVNETVKALAPLCGGVKEATSLLDEMSNANGNMLNLSDSDLKAFLKNATANAYMLRSMGAAVGMSGTQVNAMAEDLMGSISGRGDIGLSQRTMSIGAGSSLIGVVQALTANMLDYKHRNPSATSMQLTRNYTGLTSKLDNYLGSGADNYSAIVASAASRGEISNAELLAYKGAIERGDSESAFRMMNSIHPELYVQAINPAEVAEARRKGGSIYSDLANSGIIGQNIQMTRHGNSILNNRAFSYVLQMLSESGGRQNVYDEMRNAAVGSVMSDAGIKEIQRYNPNIDSDAIANIRNDYSNGKITSYDDLAARLQRIGVGKASIDRILARSSAKFLSGELKKTVSRIDTQELSKKLYKYVKDEGFTGVSENDLNGAAKGKTGIDALRAQLDRVSGKTALSAYKILENIGLSKEDASAVTNYGNAVSQLAEVVTRSEGISESDGLYIKKRMLQQERDNYVTSFILKHKNSSKNLVSRELKNLYGRGIIKYNISSESKMFSVASDLLTRLNQISSKKSGKYNAAVESLKSGLSNGISSGKSELDAINDAISSVFPEDFKKIDQNTLNDVETASMENDSNFAGLSYALENTGMQAEPQEIQQLNGLSGGELIKKIRELKLFGKYNIPEDKQKKFIELFDQGARSYLLENTYASTITQKEANAARLTGNRQVEFANLAAQTIASRGASSTAALGISSEAGIMNVAAGEVVISSMSPVDARTKTAIGADEYNTNKTYLSFQEKAISLAQMAGDSNNKAKNKPETGEGPAANTSVKNDENQGNWPDKLIETLGTMNSELHKIASVYTNVATNQN